MSKPFTVRTNTTNRGGVYTPLTVSHRWMILIEGHDMIVVDIPSKSCPRDWLKERGYTIEVDALAQIMR